MVGKLSKSIVRNTSIRTWTFRFAKGLVTNAFGSAISMLLQILLARYMGAKAYGRYALTLSLVLLPASVLDLGVLASTPRFLAVKLGEKRHGELRSLTIAVLGFILSVSIPLTLTMVFGTELITDLFKSNSLDITVRVFSFFIPAVFLHRFSTAVLKGAGKSNQAILVQTTLLHVASLLTCLGSWFFFGNILAVVIAKGVAYIVATMIGLLLVMRWVVSLPSHRAESPVRIGELIHHGLPLNIIAIAERILRRCDVFVIGIVIGESAVGVYRVASTLVGGIQKALVPIGTYSLFYLGKAVGQKNRAWAGRYYDSAVILSMTLALPCYLFVFWHSSHIVIAVYGIEYAKAGMVLRVLSIGFAFFVSMGPVGSLYNTVGKNWLRMFLVLILGGMNLVMSFFLARLLGIIGVAYATVLAYIILFLVLGVAVRAHVLHQPFDRKAALLLSVAFFCGGLGLFMASTTAILSVIVRVILASSIFCLGVCLLGSSTGFFEYRVESKDRS